MAPTSGRMHPIAAFLVYGAGVLLVLILLALTTYANISVWFGSATGHDRYVFGVSGLVFEVWGAIGLIIALHQIAQKGSSHTARGLAALVLWIPAILFNAYTTQRYFAIENGEKAGVAMIDQMLANQSGSKIGELEAELATIGVMRTPAEIIAERDALPENYLTKRRKLNSELGRAERRAEVMTDLEEVREAQLATVGASAASEQVTVGAGEILTGLGIWIEAFKAFGLWILLGSRNSATGSTRFAGVANRGAGDQTGRKRAKRTHREPVELEEGSIVPSVAANTDGDDKVVEIRPKATQQEQVVQDVPKTRYL